MHGRLIIAPPDAGPSCSEQDSNIDVGKNDEIALNTIGKTVFSRLFTPSQGVLLEQIPRHKSQD